MTRISKSIVVAILILWAQLLGSCGLLQLSPKSQHLALGNPSQASTNPDNFLIVKPQYTLSYNRSKGRLNWASWQLDQSWFGDAERQNDFRPDPELPSDWPRITPTLYRRSGYDRGHMVPSGDRTRSVPDNSATFVMSNIIPQAPDNNQGPWVDLENYSRDLVEGGKSLYVIAGGYGDRPAIGKRLILPPQQLWKIVVVLDGDISPRNMSETTRIIAVDIPNQQGVRQKDWQDYLVSIDEIEAATGYDFLSEVTETLQTKLESRVDQNP